MSSTAIQWRDRLIEISIILTLLLIPFWLKRPDASPPFTATYITGFWIVLPVVSVFVIWLVGGLPGHNRLWQNRSRLIVVTALVSLATLATISQLWAFIRTDHPGVAQNAALQLWLSVGFLIVIAAIKPPARLILRVMIVNLVLHGLTGAAQVAVQSSLGLAFLGELSLNPAESGISVIQTGDMRWLRPYGLLPHPNLFAGIILTGTLASVLRAVHRHWRVRLMGYGLFLFGLWMLLLTFSRSAWLGFGVGVLVVLPIALRKPDIRRRLLPLTLLAGILTGVFVALYHPLLLTRTASVAVNTEMRSIADRIVFTEIALDAIQSAPLQGIGAGNMPWYASHYLFYNTDYDLRGDNVHNIYLSVWAELGIIGLSLLLIALMALLLPMIQRIRQRQISMELLINLATWLAFCVIGFFDHYPWTMLPFFILWLTPALTDTSPGQPETIPATS